MTLHLHPGNPNQGIGVKRYGLALSVELLVALGVGPVVAITPCRRVELGDIAQLGQAHRAAIEMAKAQRHTVDDLHHIDVIIIQTGQYAIGAQLDHHLVAVGETVGLGQCQTAVRAELAARRIVHAETL